MIYLLCLNSIFHLSQPTQFFFSSFYQANCILDVFSPLFFFSLLFSVFFFFFYISPVVIITATVQVDGNTTICRVPADRRLRGIYFHTVLQTRSNARANRIFAQLNDNSSDTKQRYVVPCNVIYDLTTKYTNRLCRGGFNIAV